MRNPFYMTVLFVLAVLQPAFVWSSAQRASSSADSLPTPEVFAPGVISGPANDGSPTFSPDGNTLFFTRSTAHWSIILESHKEKTDWSKPVVAPFSGEWPDASPSFSADGSYLVFVSVRRVPPTSGSAPASGPEQTESNIWRVDRISTGWSAAVKLSPAVNCFQSIFRPSVAGDGSIYFTAAVKGKNLSLFRALYRNGGYLKAEPLPFSDGSVKDVDPEIAPDQSFLIFSSRRAFPGEDQHEHLFIAYNRNGQWGSIEPIRYNGDVANGSSDDNDPRLGSDRKTLYFSSDRTVLVHFPRTRQQAIEDAKRLDEWDNSNTNVWTILLNPS